MRELHDEYMAQKMNHERDQQARAILHARRDSEKMVKRSQAEMERWMFDMSFHGDYQKFSTAHALNSYHSADTADSMDTPAPARPARPALAVASLPSFMSHLASTHATPAADHGAAMPGQGEGHAHSSGSGAGSSPGAGHGGAMASSDATDSKHSGPRYVTVTVKDHLGVGGWLPLGPFVVAIAIATPCAFANVVSLRHALACVVPRAICDDVNTHSHADSAVQCDTRHPCSPMVAHTRVGPTRLAGALCVLMPRDVCTCVRAQARLTEICVQDNLSVGDFKYEIEDRLFIPPQSQRLFTKGTRMQDGPSLHDYTIADGATVHLRITSAAATAAKSNGRSNEGAATDHPAAEQDRCLRLPIKVQEFMLEVIALFSLSLLPSLPSLPPSLCFCFSLSLCLCSLVGC